MQERLSEKNKSVKFFQPHKSLGYFDLTGPSPVCFLTAFSNWEITLGLLEYPQFLSVFFFFFFKQG